MNFCTFQSLAFSKWPGFNSSFIICGGTYSRLFGILLKKEEKIRLELKTSKEMIVTQNVRVLVNSPLESNIHII